MTEPNRYRKRSFQKGGGCMAIGTTFLATWRPRALVIQRTVTAYLLIPHGTAKHFTTVLYSDSFDEHFYRDA